MVVCYVIGGVLAIIVFLYGLIELNYFLRIGLSVILARFCKKRLGILESTYVHGICLSTDVDTLLYHMNNARYLREIDFARADFYERTGLYRAIRGVGGAVVQGASTIRYRRFVRPFSIFKITSKIIYWDAKSIFMEHRFITPKDSFIRAIAICQQRVIDCRADEIIASLVSKKESTNLSAPTPSLELIKWIESNEASSASLKAAASVAAAAISQNGPDAQTPVTPTIIELGPHTQAPIS